MKATFFVTMDCNLACDYCYVAKRKARMSPAVAARALDFLAERTSPGEKIDIGFFGGEPLLELPLVIQLARLAKAHPVAKERPLAFQLISNGTFVDEDVVQMLLAEDIGLGISCDGSPAVQDAHRRYRDGRPSSPEVEAGLRSAVRAFPAMMVNAVYRPDNLGRLAEGVEYFYGLGIRIIYLTPDYSARWRETDLPVMKESYARVGELYSTWHLAGDPAHINLVESRIALLLNGGYAPGERCSMGRGEFAFGPGGHIYPCERLAGDCLAGKHCIGHVDTGIEAACSASFCKNASGSAPSPCTSCSVRDYCMHWCGCSNYFSTGYYDAPGAFLCASEKAGLEVASAVLSDLSHRLGTDFLNHLRKRSCPEGL